MFSSGPREQRDPAPSGRPVDSAGPRLSSAPPASRPSGDRATPAPRPGIDERLGDWAEQAYLKAAEVVYAVDATTGRRCGLFYGDPEIE